MLPVLWVVYIICFLCTIIVSFSAVALRIKNAEAKDEPNASVSVTAVDGTNDDAKQQNPDKDNESKPPSDKKQESVEDASSHGASSAAEADKTTENGRSPQRRVSEDDTNSGYV